MSGTDSTYYGTTTNDNVVVSNVMVVFCHYCHRPVKQASYDVGATQFTCGSPDCRWLGQQLDRIDRANARIAAEEERDRRRALAVAQVLMED